MGFVLPDRIARLVFEGTELDGAEVRCRLDVPLGIFLEFQRLMSDDSNADAFERSLNLFAERVLVDWNLEDALGPVPATLRRAEASSGERGHADSQGMVRGGATAPFRVRSAVQRWKHVGGAIDPATGRAVTMPPELVEAKLLDALCQRWGSPPSAILAEPAALVLHVLDLVTESMNAESGKANGGK